jgi:Protein of unknown function (DUF3551)
MGELSMIKRLAIVLTCFAALTIGADRAGAQWRPWCLIEPGLATTCIYYTFEQCMASRVGSTTYCGQNANYGDAPTRVPTRRRGD